MSDTPPELKPSLPFSLVNKLDVLSKKMIPIDSDRVMKMAERTTGLDDWGEGGFRSRLDSAVDGLNEANLNTTGLLGARYFLNWHLGNKLRVIDFAKRHPELDDVDIERPVVITGFFRTGTTFLHNVLAADPNNRVAKAWELSYPLGRLGDPLGDVAWRRAQAKFTFGFNQAAIPDQGAAHHVTADSYEEDFFLLENDMAALTPWAAFGALGYATEMLDWDMIEPYEFHKLQLKMLTAQRSAKRWVLKCPWHMWNMDALMAVYPDAQIIFTHRDIAKALASHCSLSARMAAKLQRSLDVNELGAFWLEYTRIGLERGMESREKIPEAQIYDVRLRDLMARPMTVLEDIYSQFDLDFTPEIAGLLEERIAEKPTSQEGEHEYAIEDFGLTNEQVRETLKTYNERFGV
ncbi:MAG: sulfotransferase [Deltaproteobacteria bacterium]|nr:sulfotransferase [Deltaproteobacteria bacterium]